MKGRLIIEELEIDFKMKCDTDLLSLIMKARDIEQLETDINSYDNRVVPLFSVEYAQKELNTSINDFCIEYGLDYNEIAEIVNVFSDMKEMKIYSNKNINKEVV